MVVGIGLFLGSVYAIVDPCGFASAVSNCACSDSTTTSSTAAAAVGGGAVTTTTAAVVRSASTRVPVAVDALPPTMFKSPGAAEVLVLAAAEPCTCLPDPVVSEAPFAVLIPVVAGGAVAVAAGLRRRRRSP
jgi:hypothetical protein